MTILVCGIATLLSIMLSVGIVHVGGAFGERTRTQTAADAAALAAAAESALGGDGDPAGQAARFAQLNGAVLKRCLCEIGATAAQVEVAIGPTTARARAAFDPRRVLPPTASPGRLHPLLSSATQRLVELSNARVVVVSGWRSFEEQSALWDRALREHGSAEAADTWVARPGTSRHELGLAVDLGGDLDLALELIERYGLPLTRPLAHEPWHFELSLP